MANSGKTELPTVRKRVAAEVELLVEDLSEDTETWLATLSEHVKRVYTDERGKATLRLPAIRRLADRFGWQDMELFDQMEQGFNLLGTVTSGLGWRLRDDHKYADPVDVHDFIRENERITVERLTLVRRSANSGQSWQTRLRKMSNVAV